MNGLFSIRIFSVDYYFTNPIPNLDATFSDFTQCTVSRVPVLRIFGSTPSGQRACFNVHGVFPYLMVPYNGPEWDDSNPDVTNRYIREFAANIDNVLKPFEFNNQFKNQHVYKIILVQGKPFYGYHHDNEVFMKIYFYFPNDVKRTAELLQSGAIMNRSFQPHEAHIPFILQMFLDYNLYGMNFLHARSCWFRKSADTCNDMSESKDGTLPTDDQVVNQNSGNFTLLFDSKKDCDKSSSGSCSQSCLSLISSTLSEDKIKEVIASSNGSCNILCPLHARWNSDTIPAEAYIPSKVAPRQTMCELEVDILAADILNRSELNRSFGQNPGIASIWKDAKNIQKQDNSSHFSSFSVDKAEYSDENEETCRETLNISLRRLLSNSSLDEGKTPDEVLTQSTLKCDSFDMIDHSCSLINSNFYSFLDEPSGSAANSLLADMMQMDTNTKNSDLSSVETQHSHGVVSDGYHDDGDTKSFENIPNNQLELEEAHESHVMSQPWESGMENLLSGKSSKEFSQINVNPDSSGFGLDSDIQLKSQWSSAKDQGNTVSSEKNIPYNTSQGLFNKSELVANAELCQSTGSICHLQGEYMIMRTKTVAPSWNDAKIFLNEASSSLNTNAAKHPSKYKNVKPFFFPKAPFAHVAEAKCDFSKTEFTSSLNICGMQHWQYLASSLFVSAYDQQEIIQHNSNATNSFPNRASSSKQADASSRKAVILKPFINPPNPKDVWELFQGFNALEKQCDSDQEMKDCKLDKEINFKSTSVSKQIDSVSNAFKSKCAKSNTGSKDPVIVSDTEKSGKGNLMDESNCAEPQLVQGTEDSCDDSKITKKVFSALQLNNVDISDDEHCACSTDTSESSTEIFHRKQYINMLSMELHVKTRLNLRPDPELDEIRAIFYAFQSDNNIGISNGCFLVRSSEPECQFHFKNSNENAVLQTVIVSSEQELFNQLSSLILQLDPDILMGYEVQMSSWGYLLSRASALGVDICSKLSRVPNDIMNNRFSADKDAYGADNASEIHIVGRLMLNIWRLMRTEISLYDYSFENVAFHILQQRHPRYTFHDLTLWFDQPRHFHPVQGRNVVMKYFMNRVLGNLKLLSKQDIINRTSELARIFGIQFYDVLTRGSQFRVESMMLRQARSNNFIAVSPTTLQRAGQKAPECIALVMEPESRFYNEPVIVVDFQSLYPSIVIAYNYCYSTCLGRVEHLNTSGPSPFGCTYLNIPLQVLSQLLSDDDVHVSPNAVAFVKSHVRQGVLPAMLDELLKTRIMVKETMKKCNDKEIKQALDHKQLGLKLIANFTYGYTAASYSGRMACVEIADSIVSKARQTLENAIKLVHAQRDRWGGRVVYGDTDSMFIALREGTSKKRAFEIGQEIVDAVTKSNPPPMKLKFEKVYQPCMLQTKKRYVGYAYEYFEQEQPIFDAKGIETVRRDGCPAVSKIIEKSLKILFDSGNVPNVKDYVVHQCSRVLNNSLASLQDCIIAKEYRGAKYYNPKVLVPALVLTRKSLAIDKCSEPRIGERVPYVVVHGAPNTPLYQLIRRPEEVLVNPNLKLNGPYYITKMILPALDRVMALLGVNVFTWYQELPHEHTLSYYNKDFVTDLNERKTKKTTLSQYFSSHHCISCKAVANSLLCSKCIGTSQAKMESAIILAREVFDSGYQFSRIHQICSSCTGILSHADIKCESLCCPVLYKRFKCKQEAIKSNNILSVLDEHEMF